MTQITKTAVLARLQAKAFNTSHFLWLLDDFNFFECSLGWIWAWRRDKNTVMVALDPLPTDKLTLEEFKQSYEEFAEHAQAKFVVFAVIQEELLSILAECGGFTAVKVGREPWVKASTYTPSGKAVRSLRSSRNFALKAGVTVEHWRGDEVISDPVKNKAIREIYAEWKNSTFFHMEGFLFAADPFFLPENRHFFVSRTEKGYESYLMATALPDGKYYFEDLVYISDTTRGTSELLTLTAIETLKKLGAEWISLGVVALNGATPKTKCRTSPIFGPIASAFIAIIRFFYNSDGIELFRKRFEPEWRDVYIAVQARSPGTFQLMMSWLGVGPTLVRSFKPKLTRSKSVLIKELALAMFKGKSPTPPRKALPVPAPIAGELSMPVRANLKG